MSSREQLILAEVVARLQGAPLGPQAMPATPTASLTVSRYRVLELKPANLPHISVYTVSATTDSVGGGSETQTEIKLGIWARPENGQSLDEALDPLWTWAVQQLLTDQSLGGLARKVVPTQRIWSAAVPQAQPIGDLDAHFLITHRHQAADPSQPY